MASRAQRIGAGKAAKVEGIKDNVVNSLFAKHYRDEVYYTHDWKPVPEELMGYCPDDLNNADTKREISALCKQVNDEYGTNFSVAGTPRVLKKPILAKRVIPERKQPEEAEDPAGMDDLPNAGAAAPEAPVAKPGPFAKPIMLTDEQMFQRRVDAVLTQHYNDIRTAASELADQMRAEGIPVEGIPAKGEGSTRINAEFIVRNTDP